MFKTIALIYLVCFGSYVLFTRDPDFFESEKIEATIVVTKINYVAQFNIGNKKYATNANYLFKKLHIGEKVTVVYNPQNPIKSSIYSIWGYWLKWDELLVSSILLWGLYHLANSITKNPTPEALLEQLEPDKPVRKYS